MTWLEKLLSVTNNQILGHGDYSALQVRDMFVSVIFLKLSSEEQREVSDLTAIFAHVRKLKYHGSTAAEAKLELQGSDMVARERLMLDKINGKSVNWPYVDWEPF